MSFFNRAVLSQNDINRTLTFSFVSFFFHLYLENFSRKYLFYKHNQETKYKLGSYIPGLVHAIVSSGGVMYFICSSEYEMEYKLIGNDLFAYSEYMQNLLSFSYGFFIYDIFSGIVNNDIIFIIHGVSCTITVSCVLYPFAQTSCVIYLLFEISSIPYNFCKILMIQEKKLNKFYVINQILFSVIFFIVRIVIGIPYTIHLMVKIYPMVCNHENDIFYKYILFMMFGVTLNLLNIYWLKQILKIVIYKYRMSKKEY